MNRSLSIVALFDYSYWATQQLLTVASETSHELFVAPGEFTYRGLRATLVLALDVETSWRQRLRGEPASVYDEGIDPERFPDVSTLRQAWEEDEAEMRAWLLDLSEDELSEVVDLGPRDCFPRWMFLTHIITHSTHQRRDVALILERAGHSPPEIDYLYYADSLV